MNLLAPVSTIMSRELVTIDPDSDLSQVERIFKTKKIHHILVTEGKELKGIISKSDFLFFLEGYDNRELSIENQNLRLKVRKAKEIMTSRIAQMQPNQKLDIALAIFKENLFHAIPIVDDNELVGIVTTFDFIKHLAEDNEVVRQYQFD